MADENSHNERLKERVSGNRDDTMRILRDIGEALSYLHGHRLIQKDIKPANILYLPERGDGLDSDKDAKP